uniref:Uncharacterized protein n=1 Tax=Lactuca sativa TaxID=4236 RepID=A0A9R1VG28_LACSA|nr:hypothetical protein LSAT_V11C500236380 [Lactuca sativa]
MAVLVEHMEGQRDLITHKSIWHLSDQSIKNVCESSLISLIEPQHAWSNSIHLLLIDDVTSCSILVADTFYIMFTVWGCCFFGSTKDPYYDSEHYRKDGGDGTGHWVYEKQEDIEEKARSELWREELIEEIEKKVGGLRELEEAKEEELVK